MLSSLCLSRTWRHLATLLIVLGTSIAPASDAVDPFLNSSYFQTAGKPATQPLLSETPAQGSDAIQKVAYLSGGVQGQAMSPVLTNAGSIDTRSVPAYPQANFADLVVDGGSSTQLIGYERSGNRHRWQILPDGLIYRSFLAGPREPRISTHFHDNHLGGVQDSETLWSGTVGGRRGLIRFGDDNPLRPSGFQLDIEGAALVRLNLDEDRDVDGSDFRFGVPLTWGDQTVQYEFGYYHLSSHIGDEFLVRNPGFARVNYVRDVIKLGVSYYPVPQWRLYGQTGYAVFTSGGAEPWEFQFGAEYSQPGVTGICGTPFFAVNAHLREELDFGGDFTAQAGWLWRGESGSTFRVAAHYYNGDSLSYQFFDNYEEQIGVGLFYDF